MECIYKDGCSGKDCENDFCLRKYKLDALYNLSQLSEKQRGKITLRPDADNTDLTEFKQLAEIQNNIVDFVNNGENLFIHSTNCGNGKTSWTIKLAQAYINKIWLRSDTACRVLFISVPRFLQALKDNISNKNDYALYIKENAPKADLVIWDEISAKAGTEFEISQLLSLIDNRISEGKANIYTANTDYRGVAETLGDRLASRICLYGINIELHGRDKRGLKN